MTSPAAQALRKTLEAKLARSRAQQDAGLADRPLPPLPDLPVQTRARANAVVGRPGGPDATGPDLDATVLPPLPGLPPQPDLDATVLPPLPGLPPQPDLDAVVLPPVPGVPHSPNAHGRHDSLSPAREGHSGRRGDILEQFHTRTGAYEGRADDAVAPTIFKLTIAGSGGVVWKTKALTSDRSATTDGKLEKIFEVGDWKAKDTSVYQDTDKGDLMFSGPMGLGGTSDSGANSIDMLVKKVPGAVIKALPPGTDGTNVVLIVKAHSRGAVAASIISKALKRALPKLTIELTQFDPVPGPANYGKKNEIDLGQTGKRDDITAALDETTIVYSMASGYSYLLRSFVPQRVFGVKRIILSAQNHGGGIRTGYMIGDQKFKGARLNSIPPGAYYETGVIAQGQDAGYLTLERMNQNNFMAMLDATYAKRVEVKDTGRYDNVKAALKEFFKRNGG
ncbi:hypothetical protein [Jatrophihabitans fulvus]